MKSLPGSSPARSFRWADLKSSVFWTARQLNQPTKTLLIVAVAVLLFVSLGFYAASGDFSGDSVLNIGFYLGLGVYAFHPRLGAAIALLTSAAGELVFHTGGNVLELAIALCLTVATCGLLLIPIHFLVVATLTLHLSLSTATLTDGGAFGIVGIAVISGIAGLTFRLGGARESKILAERAHVVHELEQIASEEQEHIADELHDGIAHDLTLILFHARALPKQPDATSREVSLKTIEASAEQALENIQSLLMLLRDTNQVGVREQSLRYGGSLTETIALLGRLLEGAGVRTEVNLPQEPLSISRSVERALVQTVIESVTNIMRHAADAETAGLSVTVSARAMQLRVTSASAAVPSSPRAESSGRGLRRSKHRIESIGGVLSFGPSPEGWFVQADVPALQPSEQGSE